MTKFKNFVMGNPALSEEQKRLLLGKAEELFQSNISEKLNLKELEFISRIDEQMLKDKFVKDCIGDHISIVKKINKEEKDKKLKKVKPGYNADFDIELMVSINYII
jgi:golgin subfamily A member 4